MNCLSQIKLLKDSIIKRKLIVLKMFFEYLARHKYIEKNYYTMHSFKFRQERRLPKILTPKEVLKLLTYAQDPIDRATQPFNICRTAHNLALIDIITYNSTRPDMFFPLLIPYYITQILFCQYDILRIATRF